MAQEEFPATGEGRDPAIRRAAMDLLARREHCRAELVRKLQRRFGDSPAVAVELDHLAAEGLQSDLRFACGHARQRARARRGPLLIRAELRQRQVPEALIDTALEAAVAECGDWAASAHALVRERFGDAPAPDRREWGRRARFLQSRGFSSEQVGAVLRADGD